MNNQSPPAELRHLAAELAEAKLMRRGSLSERMVKCSKPGYPCADNPGARHGPYFSLTRALQGKTEIFCDTRMVVSSMIASLTCEPPRSREMAFMMYPGERVRKKKREVQNTRNRQYATIGRHGFKDHRVAGGSLGRHNCRVVRAAAIRALTQRAFCFGGC